MLKLRTLHGETFYLNPEIIVRVEKVADTIVTLTNGDKVRVLEEPEKIVELFLEYKQKTYGFLTR